MKTILEMLYELQKGQLGWLLLSVVYHIRRLQWIILYQKSKPHYFTCVGSSSTAQLQKNSAGHFGAMNAVQEDL